MKKQGMIAGLLALCLVYGQRVAWAEDAASVKKAIQAIYKKEIAATEKKDIKGIVAHYAPEYQETGIDGTTANVSQITTKLSQVLAMVKSIKIDATITKITVKGDKATVVTKATITMTAANPQTQKDMKLVLNETAEEQWQKKNGAWLEYRSKTLTAKQSVDGKEMPLVPPTAKKKP